jgi:phospholipid transport system substrate-binding protein
MRPSPIRTSRLAAAAAVALLLTGPGSWAASNAAETPTQVIDRVSKAALEILRNKETSSDEKRTQLEKIVYANVDFPTLSRLVLARNWRRLNDAEHDEFMKEFKRHLSVTYGKNIDNYKNEDVAIIGDREEIRGDHTVQTKILRGGGSQDVQVDYRLRKFDDHWRIIDVIVEGVSMVANFRSQFQEIIANGGPKHLIELLREKNEKGESLKS